MSVLVVTSSFPSTFHAPPAITGFQGRRAGAFSGTFFPTGVGRFATSRTRTVAVRPASTGTSSTNASKPVAFTSTCPRPARAENFMRPPGHLAAMV